MSIFLILTSNKIRNFELNIFKKDFSSIIKNFINSKNVLFLIPIAIYTYLWQPYSLFYFFSILIFVIVIRNIINYEDIEDNDWIYKTLIISVIIVGFTLPFAGPFHENVPASPGLFPEPSHLGFSIGPVLGVLTRKKKYSFIGVIGMTFFCIFSFSKSLIISYFFSIIFGKRFNSKFKSQKAALVIIFSLIIIISVKSLLMYQVEGFNENQIDFGIFGSSLIWFFWVKHSLVEIFVSPFGTGPFGWLQGGLEAPLLIRECNYKTLCFYLGEFITSLNQRDMASLFAFGLSSFGFLYPFYLFYLLNKICKNTIKVSNNYYKLEPISILLLSYISTYMFRWSGFTAGPLIGLLCLMPKPNLQSDEDIYQSSIDT